MKTQMLTTKKTRTTRLLAILFVAVLLVGTLAGCGSGKKGTLPIASTITAADGGNMKAEQIQKTAEMLASVYDDSNFDVRDYLIAASRGYDMLAEGYDDANYENFPTDNPSATAVKIIDAANAKAKDKAKIDRTETGTNYENLNDADLAKLISVFQTEVDTTSSGGVFDVILRWIGTVLNWITRYLGFGSYIVGICVFAVIIELLMLPFAVRQQKNSIRQAKLRPKEMAIRNKYAGRTDQKTQQAVQQEIQALYQRENFSPYSGCLPLLLQMPILIALYRIVVDPLHYVLGQSSGVSSALNAFYTAARAAGGLGNASTSSTIQLLSGGTAQFEGIQNFAYFKNGADIWTSIQNIGKIPNFNIGKWNFGINPSFSHFNILLLVPVLTFVVYFFSMRLNRKFTYQPGQTPGQATDRQTACSNTMMDVTMPLMSTFFTFVVPAIVGVYWMFRSVLGVLKQFIMSKVMPLPQFTEEDYKAAAREMAGKRTKVVKSENAGKVRSLHHIDDEDYDDTREAALARKAAIAEREKEEQAKRAKDTPVDAAFLKEENRHDDKKSDN
ncbi:MAG: YidC/Oxa1 family membrane protein insertase [Clostridia bacterium]|nr:YidC/Oxa1 family membrane protein insertase [Clostridia bacterium]